MKLDEVLNLIQFSENSYEYQFLNTLVWAVFHSEIAQNSSEGRAVNMALKALADKMKQTLLSDLKDSTP